MVSAYSVTTSSLTWAGAMSPSSVIGTKGRAGMGPRPNWWVAAYLQEVLTPMVLSNGLTYLPREAFFRMPELTRMPELAGFRVIVFGLSGTQFFCRYEGSVKASSVALRSSFAAAFRAAGRAFLLHREDFG